MNQLTKVRNVNSNFLIDSFGRKIRYIRMSVTDRCDFRCVYCMNEDMRFLPRDDVLTLEELGRIASVFSELGVEKIRLTGGEPLVRKDITQLTDYIGTLGFNDFTMTTNGSQLVHYAQQLKQCGLTRLNISLDSLDQDKFHKITRTGYLDKVIKGIDAAITQGFESIKINTVIMKGRNDDEVLNLVEFARDRNIDISFIEEMPIGIVTDHSRKETFCSSDEVKSIIEQRYALKNSNIKTSGPSRYFTMQDSSTKVGFISPYSHNFCSECDRVRITAEGRLLLCLGNEHSIDLRSILRSKKNSNQALKSAISNAILLKPEQHLFDQDNHIQVLRLMNMTGG
ncbi:GTP 3',8-cyclase MoaA [Nitrincola nitratireducens]|uniref:GTP 3',8-cyclase n=1 Tax=Nitrincola nitratireducens TaxID=1229521 RepID=W9UR46_9GAMM|nr:GTP 3',8-cyclase MoaA [Nitrincola nitratireducens]EXJ09564.1 putative molybdopterin cofactor synthesis protein A [Nitrincola nitratireducens]